MWIVGRMHPEILVGRCGGANNKNNEYVSISSHGAQPRQKRRKEKLGKVGNLRDRKTPCYPDDTVSTPSVHVVAQAPTDVT